jgi:hypothetical protein
MKDRLNHRRGTRWAAAIVVGLLVPLLLTRRAEAHAWMIRHGFTGCTGCHTDPSGSALLTPQGRAQGELLLRSQYLAGTRDCPDGTRSEACRWGGFLWGALDLPDELRLGGNIRAAYSTTKNADDPVDSRLLLMRSDLFADLKLLKFRAAGSIGYAATGSELAALSRQPTQNLVSREHWVGFELDEAATWLARGGRVALPFGLRSADESLWVRDVTRTNIVDQQQYGFALSLDKRQFRGEFMGILGNFQIRPDEYRERGYSVFFEYAPVPDLAIGVSSLVTRARRDIVFRVSDYRQAHGLFARYVPIPSLVIMAEGDIVYHSLTWNGHRSGHAALLHADWEPIPGLHLGLGGEHKNEGGLSQPNSYGGRGSIVWFFAPHADLRLDDFYQRISNALEQRVVLTLLAQLHVYL